MTNKTRSCLVSIYGSGNALAAIAAVRWHCRKNGDDIGDVVTLVHPPSTSRLMASANGAVVEKLTGSQGWSAPLSLTDDDVDAVEPKTRRLSRYVKVLDRFRRTVGRADFDQIYFAHDLVGRVPQLAMNSYPTAERIVYGDALGSVYDKEYTLALAAGASFEEAMAASAGQERREGVSVRKLLRDARNVVLGSPKEFRADVAELILPMDQTGRALSGIDLSVVPKQEVLSVVADCQRVLPELAQWTRHLLASTNGPHYLMLLENFADADMISFEAEVDMYEAMVRRHVPLGATVILKAHPLVNSPVDERLSAQLGSDYATTTMPRDLSRYPMELWRELAESCHVLSVLSYCGISLSFLYGTPAIYPLDDDFVEKYFPRRAWYQAKEQENVCKGQLAKLSQWNGAGLLWSGDSCS